MDAEPLITIAPDERVLIIGTSGSGKSWHTRRVLVPRYAVRPVVFDPKEKWNVRGAHVVSSFRKRLNYQVIRLPDYDERMGPMVWDAQAAQVLRDAPHTLIIDEFTLVTPPRQIPPSIGRILRTGRDTKHGSVGAWLLTQQPVYIPSVAWALAPHKFIFMQENDDDIITIGRRTTRELVPYVRKLRKYDYVYYNREKGLIIPVTMKRT